MARRQGPRAGRAFLGSVAIHLAALAAVGLGAAGADPAPRRVKVYRVDIVSPAPNVLGEPLAEPPAPAEPGPDPGAPPPAATPTPAPAEPEPAPETPRAAPPAETPKQRAPEPPRRPAESRPRAETPPRPAAQPRPAEATRQPAAAGQRAGTGSGTTRSAGTGTRAGPATGRNPDPGSAGGEGLNVRTRGIACPENYCNNVVRQVRRFFRAPAGTQGASGNVCFTLFRNGAVEDVTVEQQRGGGFQFRLALVEAVEQAGLQKAFGPLPGGFEAESIQLCVLMSPATT